MLDQKVSPIDSSIKPLLFLFHIVVEHTEKPNLPSLQPHKLISIIDFSILVDTSEEATVLVID
jgi:hypothetical protein